MNIDDRQLASLLRCAIATYRGHATMTDAPAPLDVVRAVRCPKCGAGGIGLTAPLQWDKAGVECTSCGFELDW